MYATTMNTQDAKRVLETALICAHQPLPLREMRMLFADELGADTLRALLEGLGCEVADLGIVPDSREATRRRRYRAYGRHPGELVVRCY